MGGAQKLRFTVQSCSGEVRLAPEIAGGRNEGGSAQLRVLTGPLHLNHTGFGLPGKGTVIPQPADPRMAVPQVSSGVPSLHARCVPPGGAGVSSRRAQSSARALAPDPHTHLQLDLSGFASSLRSLC
jgi:hypothetical protein